MIYLTLFLTFLEIGAFTFGGGYAMLPLIEEAVIKHGWLSERELIDFIAVSESTPGPFAINISTYVGRTVGGIPGALLATLGVVLPSFLIILIVAKIYDKFKKSPFVEGAMSGLKPAVIGLIAAAILSVARTVFFENGISLSAFSGIRIYICAVIFVPAVIAAFKKVHPILIIIASAALGIAAGYIFNISV